jgi:hypothetical protein
MRHPTLACRPADDIMSGPLTLDDARQAVAREHGFADWADMESQGAAPPDADFEAAVDALLAGDVEALRGMLSVDPSLARRRSNLGHRATLLHYASSNGVETHRQRVPTNLAEVVACWWRRGPT